MPIDSFHPPGDFLRVRNPQGDRTTISYDNAGQRTSKKLANATRTTYQYDDAGQTTRLVNITSAGATISSFVYKYDLAGNRTRVFEADGAVVTWTYDAQNQLLSERRSGANAYAQTYTFDPAGNRTLKEIDAARTTYAYDAANQLRYGEDATGRTTYTFDPNGNQQLTREPSGNRTTVTWDYENQPTLYKLPDATRVTATYNADNRRVQKDAASGTTKFLWDIPNDSYLLETDGADATQATYTVEPAQYGRVVSQRRGSTTSWYHFDAIGSMRQLTDGAGTVTDTNLYDVWGANVSSTGSTIGPFGWIGENGYHADASEQYYVRARAYASILGRWLSQDPLMPRQAMNWYNYSRNRATVEADPSGLLSWKQESIEIRAGGYYNWVINFVLGPTEKSGWIIQHVSFDIALYSCDCGSGLMPKEFSVKNRGFLESEGQQGVYDYYEGWYVHNGEVHGTFRGMQTENGCTTPILPPRKGEPLNRDTFFLDPPAKRRTFGCGPVITQQGKRVCCGDPVIGKIEQWGQLMFVADPCMPAGLVWRSGIKGPGDLPASYNPPKGWNDSAAALYRDVIREYNGCCPQSICERMMWYADPPLKGEAAGVLRKNCRP